MAYSYEDYQQLVALQEKLAWWNEVQRECQELGPYLAKYGNRNGDEDVYSTIWRAFQAINGDSWQGEDGESCRLAMMRIYTEVKSQCDWIYETMTRELVDWTAEQVKAVQREISAVSSRLGKDVAYGVIESEVRSWFGAD